MRKKTYLLAREVDTNSTLTQKASIELVLLTGHASNNDITKWYNILQSLALKINNLMRLFLQSLTTSKLLHTSNINRVNTGAIISEQSSKRTTNNFRAVHDANRVSEETVSVRQDGVVDVEVLENLDVGERGARQDGLLALGFAVQEADVLVHVEDVAVAQALNVFGYIDYLLQVLVLASAEDGVVDDYAVDVVVGVCVQDGLFDVVAGHLAHGVLETTEEGIMLVGSFNRSVCCAFGLVWLAFLVFCGFFFGRGVCMNHTSYPHHSAHQRDNWSH